MARPREFDETEVLERAMDAFWAKGFDGTSVDDLVSATGLARQSLYGAFGGKEQLYERVLAHYAELADRATTLPDPALPTREALRALLESWLGAKCAKVGPRGCFLAVAATGSEEASFARAAFHASLRRREKLVAGLLERGQARGEIAPGRDSRALAKVVVTMTHGIATEARAGASRARLADVLDATIDLVVG